ncbi:ABC transporter transmembrane domain-containing protein [Pseudomaricurvus sp. HS19]|uniref:ABC transporter transmembrane domain-containing protein n=1 Tax=Pseudomaricurvus sp. HS19 TaxID=2692626 RepID=UPI00136AA68C|nr:ABC transporter transmembrane domain-containing protein [Pseudomaricurvus sp. HS19]MYM64756.1 hypothetical protein [Pseudomaricurvus sp. HS19]
MTLSDLKRGLKPRLLLISLAIMLLSLALPIAMLQIYDRILPNHGVGTAWVITLGVFSAIVLESVLRYGRAWWLNRAGMKYEAWSNVEAVQRLLAADPAELMTLGRHGVEEGFQALRRTQDYVSGQALLALYDAPFILIFLLLIAYIGGWVVVIPLLVLAVAFVTVYLLSNRASEFAQGVDDATALRAPIIQESFARVLSLKAGALDSAMLKAFDRGHRRVAAEQAGLDEYLMRIQLVTAFFSQATTVMVVIFSAHLVISGDMSSGALAACTLLAGRIMAPVGALFSFWSQVQRSEQAQARAQELLSVGSDTPPVRAFDPNPVGVEGRNLRLPGVAGALSVTVKAGSLVWLQESGWLRWSPWLRALAKRAQPLAGATRFITAPDLEADLAYVPDGIWIFQGTVMENLTTFTASRETSAMAWSVKLGLHQRIIQLPQGYQTQLAEHFLTGLGRGTEQLLGIVRALAKQPNLLILDHADRSLDLAAQKALAGAISGLQGKMTVIATTQSPELQAVLAPAKILAEVDQ